VKAVGTIQFLPLSGMNCGTGFRREEDAPADPSTELSTECSLVSRGYFAAMGIPIVEGRPFERGDRMGTPRVLIVNEAFARRFFQRGRALGQRIVVSWSDAVPAEIVGVAGDVRHDGLTSEPVPTVFLLHAQTPGYITNLVVRASGDSASQAAAVRRAIHDVDPTQAVSVGKTMEQYLEDALARPRLCAALLVGFAVVAVVLASVGIYGLIAYVVAQRTHEIGIRLALGASRGDIFRRTLGQGTLLTAAGLALGMVTAFALRRVLSALLFDVSAGDPISYAFGGAAFAALALAAAAIPAHRASRVDPTSALRYE
jgi:predicted permease